jgi:hypothetical protein
LKKEVSTDPFCTFAKQNPHCPYVSVIQDCKIKIDRIDRALVGEDMQSGLVGAVKNLESTINKQKAVETSWIDNVKPLLYIAAGAVLEFIFTLLQHGRL